MRIRRFLSRRWYLVPVILIVSVVLVVGGGIFGSRPSIDLTVSGAVNDRLQLTNVFGFGSGCSTETVGGIPEWSASFSVALDGREGFFAVGLTDYHGPGRYVDAPVNDVRILTRHPYGRTRDTNVHAGLSLKPPQQASWPDYSSDPDPKTFGYAPPQANPYGPVGQASVTVGAGGKSASIDAVMMNAKALDQQPVRVSGSFKCNKVVSR
jgi:hypothetical protein